MKVLKRKWRRKVKIEIELKDSKYCDGCPIIVGATQEIFWCPVIRDFVRTDDGQSYIRDLKCITKYGE